MPSVPRGELDLISSKSYIVTWGGVNLGYYDVGQLSVKLNPKIISKAVDQEADDNAVQVVRGFAPTVTLTLSKSNAEFVASVIMAGLTSSKSGTAGALYGIDGDLNVSATSVALPLELVPKANATGVQTESIYFPLAFADPSEIELLGDKDNFQTTQLTFYAKTDYDQQVGFQNMWFGNILAEGNAPDFMMITANTRFPDATSWLTLDAIDLKQEGIANLYAWAANSTDDVVTAAVDDVAGIATATQKTFTYDTLAGGSIVAGDIIKVGTELMYVRSLTSTVFTVIRAFMGSTAATAADNATVTLQKDAHIIPATQTATWASSATSSMTVGDTQGSTTKTSQKGVLFSAATPGAANITATLTAVASDATVATSST